MALSIDILMFNTKDKGYMDHKEVANSTKEPTIGGACRGKAEHIGNSADALQMCRDRTKRGAAEGPPCLPISLGLRVEWVWWRVKGESATHG